MDSQYFLEVYEDSDHAEVRIALESDYPFMAIQKGDIIRLGGDDEPSHIAFRVLNFEHTLWNFQGAARHKLCVYTSIVEFKDGQGWVTP